MRRFPGAMAIGRVQENMGILSVEQLLDAVFASRDQIEQARIAMVERLAAHRFHDRMVQVGGAGRVQETVAGDVGDGAHGHFAGRCSVIDVIRRR